MLSLCSLNGVTLEAMFTSQILKWMMPTMCATKSSWHLIPRLPASLLIMLHQKVANRIANKLNPDGNATFLYAILLTALIFYLRTWQSQVLYAQFWQKQKRCLISARPIKSIIPARRQLMLVTSLRVLLPKIFVKLAWISPTFVILSLR